MFQTVIMSLNEGFFKSLEIFLLTLLGAIPLGLNCTPVTAQADALMEVAAGTSDAAVIDALMAAAMIGEGTSYEQLTYTVSLTEEKYGVGFRSGSDLVDAFNAFYADAFAAGTVKDIATVYGVQESIVAE